MDKDKNNKKNKGVVAIGAFQDSALTRTDLVEYAVSKKVQELKDKLDIANVDYKSAQDDYSQFVGKEGKMITELRQKAFSKAVRTQYSKTIKSMESAFGVKCVVYTDSTRDGRNMMSRFSSSKTKGESVVVFWVGEAPDANSRRGMDSVKAFFTVDDVKYTSKNADSLEANQTALDDRQKEKLAVRVEIENEISKTRSQKDVIMNSLIEQELSRTTEGKELLEKLNGQLSMGLLGG